jgi:hypothetical protein
MAQPQPEERKTLDEVLKLVYKLSPEEQEKLLQEMKLRDLRHELQLGIDQLNRGEGIPGEKVFAEVREKLQEKGGNK